MNTQLIQESIGIDLVENHRFDAFIDDYRKLKRILSLQEIEVFQTFTNNSRKLEYLASRFAAKEALIKAGLQFNYSEVSILNHENGAPYVVGPFQVDVMISLSHTEAMSVAFVIAKKEKSSSIDKNT